MHDCCVPIPCHPVYMLSPDQSSRKSWWKLSRSIGSQSWYTITQSLEKQRMHLVQSICRTSWFLCMLFILLRNYATTHLPLHSLFADVILGLGSVGSINLFVLCFYLRSILAFMYSHCLHLSVCVSMCVSITSWFCGVTWVVDSLLFSKTSL